MDLLISDVSGISGFSVIKVFRTNWRKVSATLESRAVAGPYRAIFRRDTNL